MNKFKYTQEIEKLMIENKMLKRQIEIKNEYLGLIYGYSFDYDGFDTVESLKGLIDSLCDYAIKAITNDDKAIIYGGKVGDLNLGVPKNILGEEVNE